MLTIETNGKMQDERRYNYFSGDLHAFRNGLIL